MISTWVQNGQRSDMSDFPDEASITLKPLMEWCWKQEAESRPTFPGETVLSSLFQYSNSKQEFVWKYIFSSFCNHIEN